MTRDPGFSCSHDNDPYPCPSQISHDVRVRLVAETMGRSPPPGLTGGAYTPPIVAARDVMVSAFSEGAVTRVQVHFRLDVEIGKDRDKRQELERLVERAVRMMALGKEE